MNWLKFVLLVLASFVIIKASTWLGDFAVTKLLTDDMTIGKLALVKIGTIAIVSIPSVYFLLCWYFGRLKLWK